MPITNSSETRRRLGDFEIIREVGRGGMGVVYEARQVSLNRTVALKVLASGLGLTSKAVQRFRCEAEAAAKLHHTNIVPVYATGEENGTHFYAMEMIAGPSLDHVIKQMRPASREGQSAQGKQVSSPASSVPGLPDLNTTGPYVPESSATPSVTASSLSSDGYYFDTVARMVAEVADALAYAHKEGVIHRDIKPSNLLLSPAGRLSLNDFGLARVLEQPGMTISGEFVGTPAYMSPEQITAGRIPLDHRTDIYSLGATLYELLALQPPHKGQSREQVLAQIVQKEPKAPRRIQKKVPVDLETICLKCLEKDPDRRYQTAGNLAEDLRRYGNRFAILAKRTGPVGRAQKWMRRNPAMAGLLVAVLLTFGTTGFFAWRAHQTDLQRLAEQKHREEEARIEKRREVILNGMVEAMAGNFAGADKAIDEAIALDADAADIRILRGFTADQGGGTSETIAHYEAAVKLRPDSVMARAGLTMAYETATDFDKSVESYRLLLTMTPITPEDLLFKGECLATSYDPSEGLELIEEAMRKKPMNIGFLWRASARLYRLYDTASLDDLGKVLRDAAAAGVILHDHPISLLTSMSAQVAAVIFYRLHNQPDKRAAAIEEAKRLDALLARFPDNPDVAIGRFSWTLFCAYELGTPWEWDPQFTELRKKTGNRLLTCDQAESYFRKGIDEKAIELFRTQKGYFFADMMRFFATLGEEQFAVEREALLNGKDLDNPGWQNQTTLHTVRLAYGRAQEAAQGMRNFLNNGGKLPPWRYLAQWEKYYRSDDPNREQVLLTAVRDSVLNRVESILKSL